MSEFIYKEWAEGYAIHAVKTGELIRCKDCVYDHRCTHEMVMRRLPGGSLIYCPVEYCSEGKRKKHAVD